MNRLPDELRDISADVLALVSAQIAKSYKALPVKLRGRKLVIAVADAGEVRTLRAIQFATEREVEALVVPGDALAAAIEHYYGERRPEAKPPQPAAVKDAPAAEPSFLDELSDSLVDESLLAPDLAPDAAALDDFGLDDLGSLDDLVAPDMAPSPAPAKSPTPPARPAAPAAPVAPPVQRPVQIEVAAVDAARLDKVDPAAVALMSSDTARNYHALPIEFDEKTVTVAFAEPPDAKALRAIQYAVGKMVRPVAAPRAALDAAILLHYPARVARAPGRYGQIPVIESKLLEDRDPELIALLRVDAARKHKAVPIERMGRRLTVAMEDPTDLEAIQDLEFVSGHTIKAMRCDPKALEAAVEKYYPPSVEVQADNILSGADLDELASVETVDEDAKEVKVQELVESADDPPAVKLMNLLIREAVARGASDIHIETYETDFRVRFRVDGVLYETTRPPRSVRNALISRIKVQSGMNIAETRMPQDGRIKMRLKDRDRVKGIDFRVSDLPTIWGEKIVMRLLDPDKLMLDMTKLGFDTPALERFERAIVKPYGMILVVGPSGCGKTNTLYSAMSRVNGPEVNIMTCEDPVEFNIRGINQVQADEGIGLTFASALRSFLRQDPNIILVGEIRDFETAEIAVKASLTGHLVLSTLHTTDAPTTVSRLVNMGIEPFLVATSVLLISAQRLVRKICENCKEPDPRTDDELLELGFKAEDLPITPYRGRGCMLCHQSGNKGRSAVFEVLEFTEALRELILAGASPIELKLQARRDGMSSLRESGLLKVKAGVTAVEEVTRETVR